MRLREIAAEVPFGSGSVVMGTGVTSIALLLDRHRTASRALLGISLAVWVALAGLLAWRFVAERPRFLREARSPAGLAGVAANAVLGERLAYLGWPTAGAVLLVLAGGMWVALVGPVLRHLRTPAPGTGFMLTVSTEAFAVLAATLAVPEHTVWLVYAAVVAAALGIGLYGFVLARFDLDQLLCGRGDHWIAGGALAISALAVGQIALASPRLRTLSAADQTLKDAAFALWVAAALWLPVLLVSEARRPRLRYDGRRWATVFPLGMYAACSFTVGSATQTAALGDFARVWVWLAVAGWTVVFAAMLHRGLPWLRGRDAGER